MLPSPLGRKNNLTHLSNRDFTGRLQTRIFSLVLWFGTAVVPVLNHCFCLYLPLLGYLGITRTSLRVSNACLTFVTGVCTNQKLRVSLFLPQKQNTAELFCLTNHQTIFILAIFLQRISCGTFIGQMLLSLAYFMLSLTIRDTLTGLRNAARL